MHLIYYSNLALRYAGYLTTLLFCPLRLLVIVSNRKIPQIRIHDLRIGRPVHYHGTSALLVTQNEVKLAMQPLFELNLKASLLKSTMSLSVSPLSPLFYRYRTQPYRNFGNTNLYILMFCYLQLY